MEVLESAKIPKYRPMKYPKFSHLVLLLGLAGAMPASAKLVAWYPLDGPVGSTGDATEVVTGNNGTLINYDVDPALSLLERGHPSAKSNLGTSVLLEKGGALNLGSDADVQPTDQFTISFYTQLNAAGAFDRFLESQTTNSNDQDGLRIDTASQGDRVRVLVRDNSGVNTQATHPTSLKTDGTWYFCAFRYDSANADGNAFRITVLELDGSVIDEAAITAATVSAETINTGAISAPHAFPTHIGTELADGSPNNALDGAMDELAFFDNSDGNGVLSDADLAAVGNFGPSGVELVTNFESDKASTSPGNPATLSWVINEPFDSLTLTDSAGGTVDVGAVTTAGEGSTSVNVSETTTYYLTGVNGEVQNTHVLKILSGAAPEITSFTASAPIITAETDVDFNWSVIGADTLTLDPGMIDVSALTTTTLTVNEPTTFTLTATNGFGSISAEVSILAINGPIPAHRHIAATSGNTESSWIDEVSGKNLNGLGLAYDNPLTTASQNTNITATYQALDGFVGATAGAYQFPAATFELWIRPDALTSDHEVLFETGGGQNGLSALINDAGVRFIGSQGDVRNLDVVVPINDMRLSDFIQVVFSHDTATDTFQATVSDTSGISRTATETAAIVYGGNGAVLGNWGSGNVGGVELNLGGRTEVAGTSPEGLTGFSGETAIFNVYDRILTETEIQAAFDGVATISLPPSGGLNAVTAINFDGANTVTLTWNSEAGRIYDAEFSSNLNDWFPIEQQVTATEDTTTQGFLIPPNQEKFFMRIIEITP